MKKAVGIGVVAGAVVIALVALIVVLCTRPEQAEPQPDGGDGAVLTDAERFKEEYESLNGKVKDGSSHTYVTLEIAADNPIKYVTVAEAIKVLDQPEAVIYVGANWCPWCRGAVPVLLEVAQEYGVKPVYYLNLDEEKSLFEIQDGELVETRHGSEDYYKLLEKLSDKLRDYVLTGQDGKQYETGEKRIYQPDVYGVKDGEIVSRKSGTVKLDEGQNSYDPLTKVQQQELKQDYEQLFTAVYGKRDGACEKEENCS